MCKNKQAATAKLNSNEVKLSDGDEMWMHNDATSLFFEWISESENHNIQT